ncbi:4-amino-4-deoxy-L-arabinose transferase-like glycosyltransferase [Roseimicrobium gellanilyticum]|uniref:4-amino-4-deoxy-L-arabinose transferase-like glycosyltransferase n=2 Tax=Roseimicrobium gellanilyticum TaxID=748857 RepID=A0A366HLZ3_9BACT|nr:4-amino-4-deoxy-L-arabinose transferase-like glycosyltransferase [Roseimicrobium gellanilyticum]
MERVAEPSKFFTRKLALDLGMVLLLLVWFALPLIFLRHSPILMGWPWMIGFPVGTLALLVLWNRMAGKEESLTVAAPEPWHAWRWVLTILLLAGVTVVTFFIPLTIHFWGGGDEIQMLRSEVWSSGFDKGLSRPLNMIYYWLGRQLTPDRIEGQLIVASLLCLANGVFLMGVVRELLPKDRILPVAAGVMMVLNRGDLSRFMIMWTTSLYWGPLCFILLATWLFLVSSRRRSRVLLFAACFSLGVALLGTEGLFPLAGVLSFLVYRYWQDRRHGFLWFFAWNGTVALFASRFVQFLLSKGGDVYQLRQTKGSHGHIDIATAIKVHLTAFLEYFNLRGALWEYWPAAAGVSVMVLLVLWLAPRLATAEPTGPSRKALLFAALAAGGAMIFGFLPFLHIPHLFRTHFLASAGESVCFAALVCLAGSFLPVRWRGAGTSLLIAGIAGVTSIATFTSQQYERRISSITFEKVTSVFEQIHSLSPRLEPGSAVLFVLDDGISSPLGGLYHMNRVSELVLGAPSYIVNGSSTEVTGKIGPKGIIPTHEFIVSGEYGYENLVAFRLSYDGTTRLITELPPALIAEAPDAARLYRPLNLLHPGVINPLPIFRLPKWSDGTPDVFDFTPGVLLGERWGERRISKNERLSREFQNDATIWVNPAGRTSLDLSLSIKPDSDYEKLAMDFSIHNDQGAEVAKIRLPKEGRTQVKLPLDPQRLQSFRFHFAAVEPGATAPPVLKAYRAGTVKRAFPARKRSDVTEPGTVLGENWHPLERYDGKTFRWVTNDAEIKPGIWSTSVETLRLTVECGPGAGEDGATLEVRAKDGEVLASTHIHTYAELQLKLSRPLLPNEVCQLHVEGGGLPSPRGEPRILNFRVFTCSLE